MQCYSLSFLRDSGWNDSAASLKTKLIFSSELSLAPSNSKTRKSCVLVFGPDAAGRVRAPGRQSCCFDVQWLTGPSQLRGWNTLVGQRRFLSPRRHFGEALIMVGGEIRLVGIALCSKLLPRNRISLISRRQAVETDPCLQCRLGTRRTTFIGSISGAFPIAAKLSGCAFVLETLLATTNDLSRPLVSGERCVYGLFSSVHAKNLGLSSGRIDMLFGNAASIAAS